MKIEEIIGKRFGRVLFGMGIAISTAYLITDTSLIVGIIAVIVLMVGSEYGWKE